MLYRLRWKGEGTYCTFLATIGLVDEVMHLVMYRMIVIAHTEAVVVLLRGLTLLMQLRRRPHRRRYQNMHTHAWLSALIVWQMLIEEGRWLQA